MSIDCNVTAWSRLVTAVSRVETSISVNICNSCHDVTPPGPHAAPPHAHMGMAGLKRRAIFMGPSGTRTPHHHYHNSAFTRLLDHSSESSEHGVTGQSQGQTSEVRFSGFQRFSVSAFQDLKENHF